MMCEVPSNAILAEQFLEHFDGMSIGSNDLTQLTLGLDRDSGLEQLASDFDERDPAVKALISRAITACRATGKYIGICGQGPSDHPDFADWLAAEGIVSISLNPDTVVETWTAAGGALIGSQAERNPRGPAGPFFVVPRMPLCTGACLAMLGKDLSGDARVRGATVRKP